jgi:hypothetical protein
MAFAGPLDSAQNLFAVGGFKVRLYRLQAVSMRILLHGEKGAKVAPLIGDSALAPRRARRQRHEKNGY